MFRDSGAWVVILISSKSLSERDMRSLLSSEKEVAMLVLITRLRRSFSEVDCGTAIV